MERRVIQRLLAGRIRKSDAFAFVTVVCVLFVIVHVFGGNESGSASPGWFSAGGDGAAFALGSPACNEQDALLLDANNDGIIQLDEYFDRVFYINADKMKMARDTMRATFRNLNIDKAERMALVDPEGKEITQRASAHSRKPLTEYEIRIGRGKLLAHAHDHALLKTWDNIITQAKKRGYARIVILSDDLQMHSQFTAEFDAKVRIIRSDWKLLFLGAYQADWEGVTWSGASGGVAYHPTTTSGAFAVGVHYSAYDLILFELRKGIYPVDYGALRAVSSLFHNESLVLHPNLVISTALPEDATLDSLRWDASLYAQPPPPLPLPKVCAVVAMKDSAETIEYAVRSLLSQTYAHIEVVVVDDGSADDSASIVASIAKTDPRVVLVTNKRNIGAYSSRNVGLRQCSPDAEIYANHDADDYSLPMRFATQIEPIIDNRAEITTALYVRTHVPASVFKLPLSSIAKMANAARVHRNARGDYKFCCREILALGTLMAKMSVFKRVGEFDETRFGGDGEFMERYLAKTRGMFITEAAFNAYVHFWKTPPIPPYYERMERTCMVGPDLNTSLSRTVPHTGDVRLAYMRSYRTKLLERASADGNNAHDNPFF